MDVNSTAWQCVLPATDEDGRPTTIAGTPCLARMLQFLNELPDSGSSSSLSSAEDYITDDEAFAAVQAELQSVHLNGQCHCYGRGAAMCAPQIAFRVTLQGARRAGWICCCCCIVLQRWTPREMLACSTEPLAHGHTGSDASVAEQGALLPSSPNLNLSRDVHGPSVESHAVVAGAHPGECAGKNLTASRRIVMHRH